MKFTVIDCETGVVPTHESEKAYAAQNWEAVKWRGEPWAEAPTWAIPEHRAQPAACAVGWRVLEWDPIRAHSWGWRGVETSVPAASAAIPTHCTDVFVGHNIKFDASHIPVINTKPVWDTMIAEYILTAQQTKFASLETLRARHVPHMDPKGDVIDMGFKSGRIPPQLPVALLTEYLAHDVRMTGAVFMAQWGMATPAQRALIMVQSGASLAYGDMEANGLELDGKYTIEARDRADTAAACAVQDALGHWETRAGKETAAALDKAGAAMTPAQLAAFFFGRPAATTILVPLSEDERATLGAHRKHRKFKLAPMEPLLDPAHVGAARGATGAYSTDDAVLARIIARRLPGTATTDLAAQMAECAQKYRAASKLSKTYYTAWLDDITTHTDRRLHPRIHSTSTNTGRTSSAKPNVQNIPDAARKCVVSRYVGGVLIEVDFKQLEIIGLAQVSKCPHLIDALQAGVDIHYLSGKSVFGWTDPSQMTKEDRRVVKTINFGLIYGGGATALAEQAGVSVAMAQSLIDGFYGRFPGVRTWQDETYQHVKTHPDQVDVVPDPRGGGTMAVHWLKTETGRAYAFPLRAPDFAPGGVTRPPRPSRTEVKNYPVQGFATGDIVPLAVYLVWQRLRAASALKPKLIAAVHDSILIDVPPDEAALATGAVRDVIQNALPAAIKSLWDIDLVVPLTADHTTAPTWTKR